MFGTCTKVCTGTACTGIDVIPNLQKKCPSSVWMSYRNVPTFLPPVMLCRAELTGDSGAGINVVPVLRKFKVPDLISYRTYRNVRCRYWRYRNVSGTCTKVCTGTACTSIDVIPILPKCPVSVWMSLPNLSRFPPPVLMFCRTYRSFWCRY